MEEPTKTSKKDNTCPKCKFAGLDSNSEKFSEELMNQFPRGYASEKHPKLIVVKKGAQQLTEFETDDDGKIVFEEKRRCPVCGYKEGDKL